MFFIEKLLRTNLPCGSALISAKAIKNVVGPIGEKLGLTGGEDTLLFGTLLHQYRVRS